MLKHFCDICGQELYDYQPKDGMYIDSPCDTKIVSIQNPTRMPGRRCNHWFWQRKKRGN